MAQQYQRITLQSTISTFYVLLHVDVIFRWINSYASRVMLLFICREDKRGD